jgi:phospholipid N-methyltransferase
MLAGWKPKPTRGYAQQTYASPYAIVRYPHQKRVSTAVEFVIRGNPGTVLDYGAGDGKVLIDLLRGGLPDTTELVAFEPVERFQNDLLAAADAAGVADRIELVRDRSALAGRRFDQILCLGVLEHMPLLERMAFYQVCDEGLAPMGTALVDVPVEVGPTLLIKATARIALKGRDKEYAGRELVRLVLGARVFDPARYDPTDRRTWILHHRGFDYRLLREEISARFHLVSEVRTPINALPAPMGNQEVFLTVSRQPAVA